ncbi:MAG: hypothetical protein WDN67_04060 [Candidatus Moraniibacteriota bacterium]
MNQEHERLIQSERDKVRSIFHKALADTPDFDPERLPFVFHEARLPLDLLDTPLRFVSPGERVRILLLLLVLRRVNFLILDEPTNHLDLEAIESLEEALNAFPGNILLVSHDRRFLESVHIDRTLVMEEGKFSKE